MGTYYASTISFIEPGKSQIPAGVKHSTRYGPCLRLREEKDEEGKVILSRIAWRAVPSSDSLLGDLIDS